ncbi:MAG TPA: glycosyltransferase [Thermoanaerobaculia bacterium]|nr:glycosyltransferase [Thermoanaerobaculia bacterium]
MFEVVVHTPDVVGERMAGPGIRAWHLAGELARHFATTLVCKCEGDQPAAQGFRVAARGGAEALVAMRSADVLIGQPARGFRRQRRTQRVVYDLFDPVLLELREMYGRRPSVRQRIHLEAESWRVRRALAQGDLLMVATARQRELYGNAAGAIIEVPFGIEDVGVAVPGERENIILWGGGTWEWLDPATAVEAVTEVNRRGLDCRLLFLGRSRPNRHTVDRRREDRLDALIAGGAPFVEANASWTPYRDRLTWLRRSKVAIMLHRPTAEAAYSIRTRLFDAIAAAVPVITTEQGFAAELVSAEGLGVVVPPSDAAAVADGIARLIGDDGFYAACVSNLIRIQPRFAWDVVTRPLVEAVTQWQRQR